MKRWKWDNSRATTCLCFRGWRGSKQPRKSLDLCQWPHLHSDSTDVDHCDKPYTVRLLPLHPSFLFLLELTDSTVARGGGGRGGGVGNTNFSAHSLTCMYINHNFTQAYLSYYTCNPNAIHLPAEHSHVHIHSCSFDAFLFMILKREEKKQKIKSAFRSMTDI